MKCPFCGNLDSKVIDSRDAEAGELIRRRRECENCAKRFTTYERLEENLPAVIKKDGRREPFDRNKILIGVRKACEKRPISIETIETLVERVVRWVQEQALPEIEARQLGGQVMVQLHPLDEVAYVRFASVYRSFRDINEFMDELKDMLGRQEKRT